MKECCHCGKPLEGRRDKKFCDSLCRSNYHYDKAKDSNPSFYYKVQNQLRENRRVLKRYNLGGKSTVREDVLLGEGFDGRFFTHYWKNSKGDTYLFVYEYGFRKISENGKVKYVLIQWQDYMS